MEHIVYYRKNNPWKKFHLEFDDDLDPIVMAACTYLMQFCDNKDASLVFFSILSEAAHWFPNRDFLVENFLKDCIVENQKDYNTILKAKTITDLFK